MDTTPAGHQQDRDRLTVQEAAARLGVTPDAVRARIRRGTIDAVKEDGVYVVLLPHDAQQDTDATATASDTTDDALIDQLRSEVEYLRSELTAARIQAEKERERADVLQREALQRIEGLIPIALGPTVDRHDGDTPGSPESASPITDDVGHGQGQDSASGGTWGRLWRWLRGS